MPQYELNLRDYLRIFRKRRVTIIASFILVTIASAIYTSREPVVYTASSTIKIDQRNTIAGLLTEAIVYSPGDIMESEPKIIKGYTTMEKAARRLGLLTDTSTTEQINDAVGQLQGEIETERVEQTNMIRIVSKAPTAKEAVVLANTVAEVYIKESLEEKAKQARQGRQFIEDQLASLESRTEDLETRLKEFGENNINVKLAGPLQQKLTDLEFQLTELLQKYTEKHPKVVELRDQIKSMEAHIKGFSGQEIEYSRLNRELEVTRKLYGMMKEKLEETRISEAQKVGDISIVNPAVMPSAPISGGKRMLVVAGAFMGIILGFALAFIFETLDTSIGTIEDVENVVKLPVLGVIPSIEDEAKQNASPFAKLKERFLPSHKSEAQERSIRLFAHYEPKSPVTEAYRNIHTNLKLNPSRKTILVTSSGPREGKSSFSSNLGIVMAQSGLKTVLISADLRRPVLAKTFGIKKEPGLSELITGTVTLDGAMRNITDIMMGEINFEDIRITPGLENIWLIPSGHLPFNPAELLESKEVTHIIEQLKQRFDVVIFDAPPVLPVTDSSLLAPKVDCVVIVYEIGRTSREALIRTKVQLESAGAKIAGVVLNHTKSQMDAIATYPYSYQKYKYYTQEEKTNPSSKAKKEEAG